MDAAMRAVLIRTRELVAQGWTQGAWARDARGAAVQWFDPNACEWCLGGAFKKALSLDRRPGEHQIGGLLFLGSLMWGEPNIQKATDWNDYPGRAQDEVLALLDKVLV